MASITDLEEWFSQPRISTYRFHPDPEALYLWNTRVTKTYMEDLQHIEVLLRNCVDEALKPKYGPCWYSHPDLPFGRQAEKAVIKAERRAGGGSGVTPPSGRVIAELSFDFWVYLFTKTYATTIWPMVRKTLIGQPKAASNGARAIVLPSLTDFHREVEIVYKLRNRCAHHEPIVRQDRQAEDNYLDRVQQAVECLAGWINPDARRWIVGNSGIATLRKSRP